MKPNFITWLAYSLILIAIALAFWFLAWGGYFDGHAAHPDPAKAQEIQPFVSGLVVPLLTLGSTLLVIANLQSNTTQNFSSNFFKLIDQHHKLVDNLATAVEGITTVEKPSTKRDFFDDLSWRIAQDYEKITSGKKISDKYLRQNTEGKKDRDLLLAIYDYYFHIHLSDLAHYFRNLYHIVKFVERASIRNSSKIIYVKMLRAQLSNYELLLIAYNGMHEYGEKFQPLIEKYKILKNLNSEKGVPQGYERRIVDTEILTGFYPHLKIGWQESH